MDKLNEETHWTHQGKVEMDHKLEQEDCSNQSEQKCSTEKKDARCEEISSKDTDEEIDVVNFSSPDETTSNLTSNIPGHEEEYDISIGKLYIVDNDTLEYSSEQSRSSNISNDDVDMYQKTQQDTHSDRQTRSEKDNIKLTVNQLGDAPQGKEETYESSDLCSLSAVDINNSLFDTLASLSQSNNKSGNTSKQTSLENIVNRIKSDAKITVKPRQYLIQKGSENICPKSPNVNQAEPFQPKKKRSHNSYPIKVKRQRPDKKPLKSVSDRMDYMMPSKTETYHAEQVNNTESQRKISDTPENKRNENIVPGNIPMKLKLKNFCKAQMLANSQSQWQDPDPQRKYNATLSDHKTGGCSEEKEKPVETESPIASTKASSQSTPAVSTSGEVRVNNSNMRTPVLQDTGASHKLKYYESKKHLLECKLKILGLTKKLEEKKTLQTYLKNMLYQSMSKVKSLEDKSSSEFGNSSSSISETKESFGLKSVETNGKEDTELCYSNPTKQDVYHGQPHTVEESGKAHAKNLNKSCDQILVEAKAKHTDTKVGSKCSETSVVKTITTISKDLLPPHPQKDNRKGKDNVTQKETPQISTCVPSLPTRNNVLCVPEQTPQGSHHFPVASVSRVESNKVLSAYEIHRHLEPSCPQLSVCQSSITANIQSSPWPVFTYGPNTSDLVLHNPNAVALSSPHCSNVSSRSSGVPVITGKPALVPTKPIMSSTTQASVGKVSFNPTQTTASPSVVPPSLSSTRSLPTRAGVNHSSQSNMQFLNILASRANQRFVKRLRKKIKWRINSESSNREGNTSSNSFDKKTDSSQYDCNNNLDMNSQYSNSHNSYSVENHSNYSSDSMESYDSEDWQHYKDACYSRRQHNSNKSGQQQQTEGENRDDKLSLHGQGGSDQRTNNRESVVLPDVSEAGNNHVHIRDSPAITLTGKTRTKKLLKTKFIVLRGVMCDNWENIKEKSGYENLSDQVFFQHLLKLEEIRQIKVATKNTMKDYKKESGDTTTSIEKKACPGPVPETVCSGATAFRDVLTRHHASPILIERTTEKLTKCAGDATPCKSPQVRIISPSVETHNAGEHVSPIFVVKTLSKTMNKTPNMTDGKTPNKTEDKTPNKTEDKTPNKTEEKDAIQVQDQDQAVKGKVDPTQEKVNITDQSNEKFQQVQVARKRKLDNSNDGQEDASYESCKKLRFLSDTIKRQMAWAVFIFKDFLCETGEEDTNIHTKTALWLNKKLALFYAQAKTLDDQPYHTEILQQFRRNLSLALSSTSAVSRVGISFAPEYVSSNLLLSRIMKIEHRNTLKPTKSILSQDIDKLYESRVLSDDHPLTLLWKVWFDIVQHMCRAKMPQNFLYTLQTNNLSLESDIHGVYYMFVELGYMQGCGEPGRMYATPSQPDRCPVRTLSMYLYRLNKHCASLFQCPSSLWRNEEMWYNGEPMRREHLYHMMEKISAAAHLSSVYTTANVLATTPVREIEKKTESLSLKDIQLMQ